MSSHNSNYFHGLRLYEATGNAGLGMWGGTVTSTPDQTGGGGVPPHMYIQNTGRVGINNMTPGATLDVGGDITCSGILTASTKNFDIQHPDPAKTEMRLRHWCLEGDTPGGGLLYRKQIAAIKPGTTDLIMPDWFQHLAKNVLVFCNGYKHHGTAWGEQNELDPNVIHVTTSRGGIYNVMVTADRSDHCATTMCPQEVEYTPSPPQAAPQGFPST